MILGGINYQKERKTSPFFTLNHQKLFPPEFGKYNHPILIFLPPVHYLSYVQL